MSPTRGEDPDPTLPNTSSWGMASALPPSFCPAPLATNRTQIVWRRLLVFASRRWLEGGRAKPRLTPGPDLFPQIDPDSPESAFGAIARDSRMQGCG
jgi:hypothetical protein